MHATDPVDRNDANRFFTATLEQSDPEIFGAVKGELGRQRHEIELIASENIVSKAVLEAQGSVLTNKYAIRATAITAAASGSILSRPSRSSARRNFSIAASRTCSRIPAARRTRPPSWR
jgi:hypothetical protein